MQGNTVVRRLTSLSYVSRQKRMSAKREEKETIYVAMNLHPSNISIKLNLEASWLSSLRDQLKLKINKQLSKGKKKK